MKKLIINSDDGYLNLDDLPINCIFNKKITGCGGTTVALKNNKNYVIAVPTTELIINKLKIEVAGVGYTDFGQEAFGLFGTFDYDTKKLFKSWLKKDGVKKIICTYDKLPKLKDYINTKDYQLLVDEYHCLLKAYSYRYTAIDGVLNSFRDYKTFCFMSATPINSDFKPNSLSDVDIVEADWNNTDTLLVDLEYSNKPYTTAVNYINLYKKDGYISINGIKSHEAFFFINSVTDIVNILELANLNPDEVRIICANNKTNQDKLGKFKIENSTSPNKMFNFITSKSFEGADFFSEDGICFIVSTASNPHTQLAIDTDIPQIAGRIRTESNPFRNILIHIYNRTYKSLDLDVPYEEMLKRTNDELEAAKRAIDFLNNTTDNNLKEVFKKSLNNQYIGYDNGQFVLYDLLPKLELYNYQVNQLIYKSGISVRDNYGKNGVLTTDINYNTETDLKELRKKAKKMSFKDYYLAAKDMIANNPFHPLLQDYLNQPLVRDAIYKLDEDDIKKVKYTKKGVKELLLNYNERLNTNTKITKLISHNIRYTDFYSNSQIISFINGAYNTLQISESVKPADIKKWFVVESSTKRIDGKPTKGYIILRSKLIFE